MAFELSRGMIVVENDDPRVTYSQGWERIPGEPTFCTSGSFHRTHTKGATARFEFDGSHIWLIGHKSATHGNIKINVDDNPGIATINAWGDARAPTPFQKLFEHQFSNPGPHWIEVVSDLSGAQITVDAFAYRPTPPGRVWDVPPGLKLVTIAENDPRIEYTGEWYQEIADMKRHHVGGSAHRTKSRNATASVSFESAHFWIIGDMYTDRGRYSVSVDGGLYEEFSAYETHWKPFAILYERQFPYPALRRVVIRTEEAGKLFTLDAVIYEVPAAPVNAAAAPTTPQNADDPTSRQQERVA